MDSSTAAKTTLLVVDDDPNILDNLADLLQISGYEVLAAINGVRALQAMQDKTPELIISDIMMPEMDGYTFYDAVRANPDWALIPFIFLTARGQSIDIRRGIGLGADHYIVKPFEPEDLLALVQARLRRTQEIQSAMQKNVEHTKKRILTSLSHELRTPLNAIYGSVSLLQEDSVTLNDEEARELLNITQRGTQRLIRLVEDLLLVVRMDSGAVALEIARFRTHAALSLLVYEVVQNLSVAAEKRHVQIEVHVPDNLTVFCVPIYLQDILSRLVDNAIKFSTPTGGRAVIKAAEQDGAVVISVQDEGIGIDEASQKLLFERFRQIDREKLEQQGVGLGLSIVYGLIQLHGGDIRVESQPGKGSVFTVTLPLNNVET
jgi:two-component system sensor histidine kinase/response regulator